MKIFHELCEENGIEYFITCGTLLGSVRDGKIIPWDDDMDVMMTAENGEKLKQLNFGEHGLDLIMDQRMWKIKNTKEDYPWIDIFMIGPVDGSRNSNFSRRDKLQKRNSNLSLRDKYQYLEKELIGWWPNEFMFYDEMYPRKLYPLGDFQVWSVNDPHSILKRFYGDDYMTPKYTHPHITGEISL